MIQFDGVSVFYPSAAADVPAALDRLSLQIEDGEFVAIMGHNGSGKSTLARLCNGLVEADRGQVIIDGVPLVPGDQDALFDVRRKVGMVFQNPENQIVSSTVEREVAFGLENLCVPTEEIHTRVDAALAEFDLISLRSRPPHLLSGGEMQRLALASVMVMRPRVLMLDEPTTLLDYAHRKQFLATLDALYKKAVKHQPVTIVFVTQRAEEALMANRLLVLNKGKMLLDGPPKDLFLEEETLLKAGVLPPLEFSIFNEMHRCNFPLTSIEPLLLKPIL